MRIMDCVLLLFQKKINSVQHDTEKNCVKPSWGESFKVQFSFIVYRLVTHYRLVKNVNYIWINAHGSSLQSDWITL